MGLETPETLVALAVVTGAHGLRGGLRVKLYNPQSELLEEQRGRAVRLRGPNAAAVQSRVLLEVGPGPAGSLLVKLEGCTDRDAALALRGAELCLGREELPALGPGEYYLCDLIGLEVRDAAANVVGRVAEVVEYPAAQVLRVARVAGVLEVPLAPPYLREVRLDDALVIVDQLEELEH